MATTHKYEQFKQGYFRPNNPQKYTGVQPIVYRSSYELKFFRWCDSSTHVKNWGSESIVIPYIKPTTGRVARYFPDVNVVIESNGKLLKYLIEVKPSKQVQPPKTANRKSKKNLLYEQVTHAINKAKWNAAEQWCKKHNYIFKVVTEKDLKL